MKYENMNEEAQRMVQYMLARAYARGDLKPTENLCKIANARVNLGLTVDQCPCAKHDKDMFCVSPKCYREIKETGVCHCNCWQLIRKETK